MHLTTPGTLLKKHALMLFVIACFGMLFSVSCQKKLNLKYGDAPIKQVILANLYPGNNLLVNISKSKQPDDYNSVDFLQDCRVDLYEDSIFKETLPFVLKDTLSGLGYYTSTFALAAGKTYKIISTHPQLGVAEATEYLPPIPQIENITLLEHADIHQSQMTGRYSITFKDSAQFPNYYYISTFYRILKPKVNDLGDTTYVYDYIFNIPSYTPEFPNPSDYSRLFFTDATFDGQDKNLVINFPSQYNDVYKEIALIVEFSSTGKNFYEWNVQQIPMGQDFLNEGQQERANLKTNIINGYGHFTANSSTYSGIPIK